MRQVNQVSLRIIDEQYRNGIQSVHTADCGLFFHSKVNFRNILQKNRAFGQNNVLDVGDVLVFGRYMNKVLLVGFMQVACKNTALGIGSQSTSDVGRCDTICFTGGHVDGYLNGFLLPSENIGTGNAINVFKFVFHLLVDDIPDPVGTAAPPDLQFHELVGELLYIYPVHRHVKSVGKVVAYLVNFFLEFQEGIFKIDVLVETNLDGSLSVIEPRFHAFHPFERGYCPFDGDYSLILHVIWIYLLLRRNLYK